jgi:hypothetical protein
MDKMVETSADCIKLVQETGRGILGKITSMDKNAVSMHTLETKCQLMQFS